MTVMLKARNTTTVLPPRARATIVPCRSMLSLAAAVCGLLAALLFASPAMAYNEGGTVDPSVTDCSICHDDDYDRGPHGGYSTTSKRCQACHSVHEAPGDSIILLSAPLVRQTCEACHDGTGGRGVTGVLAARGLAPAARHRMDFTNVIPGGDASTGDTATATFSGPNGYLSCNDCHSPHGANVVAEFTGDRTRTDTDNADYLSTRLLRERPIGTTTSTAVYGSDWCAACHQGRIAGASAVHNHPVDSTASTSTPFTYENVARLVTTSTTALGSLGQSNRGYLMPDPRTAHQVGHDPICQQCHEDSRSVGTSSTPDEFTVTSADGTNANDNPRFQVFPHEAANASFLVEADQDLCTNCHVTMP